MTRDPLSRCLALLLWSLAQWPPMAAAQTVMGGAGPQNPLAAVPLAQLEQTRLRPLFSPSRRPAAPPAMEKRRAPPPVEAPSLMLLGVVDNGQGLRAIIRPGPAEKVRILQTGDQYAGWNVAEIAPRRLVLTQDARSSSFALFDRPGRPARPDPPRPLRRE